MKLALGTVQFGLPYGVANTSGQVELQQAQAILDLAYASGMDTLDTAIAYGDSEARLGEIGVSQWKVITKLPAMPQPSGDVAEWVHAQVTGSLARLRVSKLDSLMLHRPGELLGPHGQAYRRALEEVRAQGRVAHIGYSIYAPDELPGLCAAMQPDIIQAPFNIFDRRLLASGWLDKVSDLGVRVHVRSAFMQGLLLMASSDRPVWFSRWSDLLNRWDHACQQQGGALALALNYAMSFAQIEKVVIGVDSVQQLSAILHAVSCDIPAAFPDVQSNDLELIDPSRWKLQ